MRNVLAIALATSLILVAGCANKESKVVGKWKINIELPASLAKNPMASKVLDALKPIRLEFKSDHNCAVTGVTNPLTNKAEPDEAGTWSLKENTVTVTPAKTSGGVMGSIASQSKTKTMDCTLSEDGKTLTPIIPNASPSQGKLTFVKES